MRFKALPLIHSGDPLRDFQIPVSKRQALHLDALCYSAEIANAAYFRLIETLFALPLPPESNDRPTTLQIAEVLADAWLIVDNVFRFRSLLRQMPGLKQQDPAFRLFDQATAEIETARNFIQHQTGETAKLATSGGQIWGYIAWAPMKNGRYSGPLAALVPGSVYKGDTIWQLSMDQANRAPLPGKVHLRLGALVLSLGEQVMAVVNMLGVIRDAITKNELRLVGDAGGEARGRDIVVLQWIEVLVSAPEPANPARSENET